MAKKTKKERTLLLAFERKLEPSDALLYSGNWDDRGAHRDWAPVGLTQKTVRGTMSHHLCPADEDPAVFTKEIDDPNIQTVHAMTLPPEHDSFKMQFTLRVRRGLGDPSMCNKIEHREKIKSIVDGYVKGYGFAELSRRYVRNLANGRFLWRNRDSAEEIEVHVDSLKKGESEKHWVFDSYSEAFRDMRCWDSESKDLSELAELVANGLLGQEYVLLKVTAFARVGQGQEVFPSQEFVQGLDEKKKKDKGVRTKTLYQVRDAAAFHSQKIGNALRTIDSWYPEAQSNGPIAIEPYGAVTSQGEAWRPPAGKLDFYSLLHDWISKDIEPPVEQQHYLMAVLIRGGVFNEPKKK